MIDRSIIVELHGWRGIGVFGGPLGRHVKLGFISIVYLPFLVSDWLRTRINEMRDVLAKTQPHAEMDCFGEFESSREQRSRGHGPGETRI